MNQLVSVIIPNYNYEKTVKKCLEALINQNYTNIEIIFVDDGSSDNSVSIAAEFPCKIIKQKNKGVSAARNEGVKNSKGEILFFLDSDVALFEDAVKNTVKEFDKDLSIGCVCGIYAKEPLYNDGLIEEYRILQGHYWRISSEGFVTPAFVSLGAIRRDVFDEIGGFNENLTNCEDLEIGHRINRNHKLLLTSKVQGYHDDEYQLNTLCKKMFERARQRIPFYFYRKKLSKGFETPARALGILFAGISIICIPLAFISPNILFGSLISFILFLLTDIGQYRFVKQEKGILFTCYFMFIHWIVTLVSFLGFIKGFFDFCISKKFRVKYSFD